LMPWRRRPLAQPAARLVVAWWILLACKQEWKVGKGMAGWLDGGHGHEFIRTNNSRSGQPASSCRPQLIYIDDKSINKVRWVNGQLFRPACQPRIICRSFGICRLLINFVNHRWLVCFANDVLAFGRLNKKHKAQHRERWRRQRSFCWLIECSNKEQPN
jgi:hypothetical protein